MKMYDVEVYVVDGEIFITQSSIDDDVEKISRIVISLDQAEIVGKCISRAASLKGVIQNG